MEIIELKERHDSKALEIYAQFRTLLGELRKKELSQNSVASINSNVAKINESSHEGNDLRKLIKQSQTAILKEVEKEHKIVVKNYYRNLWMLLGFTAFGLPIGMLFGLSIGNMGMMGIGLPIGMAIGSVVGLSMDKKALAEGRQMDLEIKH